ncbi:MAG TPA: putative sulfate exporter family transporter [Gammaproteobacteria bacterium]
MTTNRRWWSGMLATEDWWSVWIGLGIFALGVLSIAGLDLVGWMARPRPWEWTDLVGAFAWSKLFAPSGALYAGWHALASFAMTYVVFTALFALGARSLQLDVRRFVVGFTVLFVVTWAAWIAGNELHLTIVDAAVDGRNRYQEAALSWGLQLGEGAPYLLALLAGLALGNFAKRFAAKHLPEAARPEWYIKTAIVFLGVNLGAQTMQASGFAVDLILTGAAATFVAYLFFWPIVYTLARRVFGFKRDVAAVVASGISVCGASAAIATAGAIRAKPIIPVTVSMVVVIFAMLELIVLPGLYTAFALDQPIVNGAALGMTVKTDGADAAAGALLDQLMIARNLQVTGQRWQEGWILSASLLTKIWIDVFIGVWAFVLAIVWIRKVEKRGDAVRIGAMEIWFRFPKFVLGYFVAWLVFLGLASAWPALAPALGQGTGVVAGPMRTMLFMLTFVAMGAITDFSKLKGMGKIALLYGGALVVVIAPIAYVVAYLFHRGLTPPFVAP